MPVSRPFLWLLVVLGGALALLLVVLEGQPDREPALETGSSAPADATASSGEPEIPVKGAPPASGPGGGTGLAGRVVDEAGAPVGGATVHLRSVGAELLVRETTTGAAGRYAFSVPPRGYGLWAEASGYASSDPVHLGVVANQVRAVDPLVLPRGAPLSGRVVDADGRALPGALVRAFHRRMRIRRATTGEDGCYVIADLAPETYGVVVTAEGRRKQEHRVRVGADGGRLDARMERGGGMRGRLRRADGSVPPMGEVIVRHAGRAVARARTAEDGAFRLADLPPGRVEVIGRAEGRAGVVATVVTPGATQDVDVRLGGGTSVSIMVRTGSGAPLADVAVHAKAFVKTFDRRGRTDRAGRVRFEDVLPGSYRLRIRSGDPDDDRVRGAVLLERDVEVGEAPADFVVDVAGGELHGMVVQPGGAPASGAAVVLLVEGRPAARVRAGSQGVFRAVLPEGPAVAVAWDVEGDTAAVARAQVGGDRAAPIDLQLEAGAHVTGVVEHAGTGLAGIPLDLEAQGVGLVRVVRTGAGGRYASGPLPQGTYVLRIEASTRRRLEKALRIDLATSEVSFRLARGERAAHDLALR